MQGPVAALAATLTEPQAYRSRSCHHGGAIASRADARAGGGIDRDADRTCKRRKQSVPPAPPLPATCAQGAGGGISRDTEAEPQAPQAAIPPAPPLPAAPTQGPVAASAAIPTEPHAPGKQPYHRCRRCQPCRRKDRWRHQPRCRPNRKRRKRPCHQWRRCPPRRCKEPGGGGISRDADRTASAASDHAAGGTVASRADARGQWRRHHPRRRPNRHRRKLPCHRRRRCQPCRCKGRWRHQQRRRPHYKRLGKRPRRRNGRRQRNGRWQEHVPPHAAMSCWRSGTSRPRGGFYETAANAGSGRAAIWRSAGPMNLLS